MLQGILQSIPWDHPAVQQITLEVSKRLLGADEQTLARERLRRTEELLDQHAKLLERLSSAPYLTGDGFAPTAREPSAPIAASAAEELPGVDIDHILSRLTEAGASVDEALRFAREDGVGHPEAQKRLARAQEDLVVLERVTLRPSALSALPPGQRQVLEGQMQALREARQALHSSPGGGPPTVESITEAARRLEDVATRVRVARAVAPPAREGGISDHGASAGAASQSISAPPYSRYAPDMDVATGCLPCGRAHLAGTVGALRSLSRTAAERGMADPQVQAGLLAADKELTALWADDWTPEKVAASPEAERRILESTIPRLKEAHGRLRDVSTPEALAAVTEELASIREEFLRQDMSRADPAAPAMVVAHPLPPTPGTHRVRPPAWLYAAPTPVDVAATTVPTDTARAFDSLAGALAARGVRVRVRNLGQVAEGVTEGAYLPEQNTILLGPAALAKDAYAVQVLAHEAAHALNDRPDCHVYDASRPYAERPEEELAQDASILAMIRAGLPIELQDGSELPPGSREIDWAALRAAMAPEDYARLVWSAEWIGDALAGEPRDYAAVTCPPTAVPPAHEEGA